MHLRRFAHPILIAATCAALLAGCATTGLSDAQRLTLYRAHAGEAQHEFLHSRPFIGWTALGDEAVAVWTKPNEAYLLELETRCTGLSRAQTILITDLLGQVSAGFDRVKVFDQPRGFSLTCRIQTIRPLDAKALRASEKSLREARTAAREAAPAN
jgi:hypothetical protein